MLDASYVVPCCDVCHCWESTHCRSSLLSTGARSNHAAVKAVVTGAGSCTTNRHAGYPRVWARCTLIIAGPERACKGVAVVCQVQIWCHHRHGLRGDSEAKGAGPHKPHCPQRVVKGVSQPESSQLSITAEEVCVMHALHAIPPNLCCPSVAAYRSGWHCYRLAETCWVFAFAMDMCMCGCVWSGTAR